MDMSTSTSSVGHLVPLPVAPSRPYDIEADWILLSTCNYRCVYCFWDEEALGRKIHPLAPVQQLASFFDNTGLAWLLHLTGGEPFVYPKFVEMCQLLTQRHLISVNTNADSTLVRTFTEIVDPGRVDFINCSVHLQQREQRRRVPQFLHNFQRLRSAGFATFASCVMYPDVFATFPQVWEQYAQAGVTMIPKALQGDHQGRQYPTAYTADQRSLFAEYSERAEQFYANEFQQRRELPTINPLRDQELFLSGVRDFRGDLCDAGYRFVRIWDDGNICRCGREVVLGNLVEGWFNRRLLPAPCADTECAYFCDKYRIRT